ncbi:hypothetical protein Avbf_04870 [Armadillidium vulgare]|nr:hypothetical protein Avbf_04870 [Armadillidium vulgare]
MESSHSSNIEEFEEDLEVEGEEEEDNQVEEEDEDENDHEEESEDEIEEDDDDYEYQETEKSNHTNDYNINEVNTPENGSATSGTLGLYSSFDSMIGGSNNENSEQSYYDSNQKVDEQLISSHLKGTLSFGLPSKGNTLRIHKPYRVIKKKTLPHHRRKSSQTFKGIGSVVHRSGNSSKSDLKKKLERDIEWDNIEHLDENLKVAYRIVMELMGDSLKAYNSIFMETIEMDPSVNGDYLEVVKDPIWLPKIKENILKGEYKTITEVISQLRLMLQNAYKYFGANHSFTRRGIKLEFLMEQKLALLRKELRELCSLETTHGITEKDIREAKRTKGCCITFAGERYFSYLLYKERGCKQAREKELKKKRLDHMRQAKILKENEILQWDSNLMEGPLGGPFRHMWELVQINQFVFLSMKVLNISQISQYEMERIFMIPEASITMRMLMTSLVSSPLQRLKLSEKPYMPYNVWARRLANKTFHWYRVYSRESHNPIKLFEHLGIEPKFWSVCGDKNPFSKKLFHEMTLYQRVWLVKTLCDYIAHTHKSVQEAIAEQPEENMREILLGKDSDGNEYIYFPHLNGTDLRVYRRSREKHQTIFEEEEKAIENKGKLFSKDQVRAFKKLIKKLKKNRERDEDWEYEQRKLKNRLPKKRGRKPLLTSSHLATPPEKRSRPERLRQTPKPRYDLLAIESCLDDDFDDEDLISLASRKFSKKNISESESEEEEDEDEDEKENEGQEDDLEKNQDYPKVEDRGKEKRGKKKNTKNICKTCGKTFRSKSAMYGHMAMHVRKKEKMKEEMNNRDEDMQVTESEGKCPIPKEEKPDPGILHEGERNEDGTIKLENLNVIQESDEKDVKIANVQEELKAPSSSGFDITVKKEDYDSGSLVKKEENKSTEESNLSPFSENKKDEIYCGTEMEKENVT